MDTHPEEFAPGEEGYQPRTEADVAELLKTAQNGEVTRYLEQHAAVMELWHIVLQDPDLEEPAIRALSDLAWNCEHKGIASQAQDRLDRISKESPEYSEAWKLARQAIRHELTD